MPLWAIRNIVYPNGARQDKLVEWVNPKDLCAECRKKSYITYYRGDRWICRDCDDKLYPIVRRNHQPVTTGYEASYGSLMNHEYRFWFGLDNFCGRGPSVCRICRTYCYTKSERQNHKIRFTPPCTIRMTEAVKILHKNSLCVICKAKTVNREWGIPMCQQPGHKHSWMHDFQRWILLEMALFECGMSINEEMKTTSLLEQSRQLYLASGS